MPPQIQQLATPCSRICGDVEEREQPVLPGHVQERPELGHGPDGAGLLDLHPWSFGPVDRVAADQLVHDDGITECLPEYRVQVGHGSDGERLAVATTTAQQVPVELGDRGRPDRLNRHVPDARNGVEPDAGPVVGQGPRLDLHRVSVEPVVQVRRHGDPVPVDVLAVPRLDPSLVPGGLGVFFGREAADPSRLADPCLGISDADHVGPGGAAFHHAIAEPRCVLAVGS